VLIIINEDNSTWCNLNTLLFSNTFVPMKGFFNVGSLLSKRLNILKKHSKTLTVTPAHINTCRFFLEVPAFTNHSFSIDSQALCRIARQSFEYELKNGSLELKDCTGSCTLTHKIAVGEPLHTSMHVDEPLISFECPHEFVKFVLKLEGRSAMEMNVRDDGTVHCEVHDVVDYDFTFRMCKVLISNVESVDVKVRVGELLFMEDVLDNTMVFCVFEDFLLVYCYDQGSTLAVKVNLLV
ncbi:hypothetical protein THOM_0248, partial [Trachipleistophora hominis]